MSHRRQSPSRSRTGSSRVASEFCGLSGDVVDFNSIHQERIEGIWYGKEDSNDLKQAIIRSRYFARRNLFIRRVLALRLFYCNAGMTLAPAEGRSGQATLDRWCEDPKNRADLRALQTYVRDAWRERLTITNLISFWHQASARPSILRPEEVKYTDELGYELLEYTVRLTDAQIKRLSLPPELRARLLQSKKLELTHDDELFSFEVLKDDKAGEGLSWPDLLPVLLEAGQWEAHAVRDKILADTGRQVIEQHKLGHEHRYGLQAGSTKTWINKARSDAVKKELAGKVGHVQFKSNFDHEIIWPCPDPKNWEPKRYQAVIDRLLWWALPLGHMVIAKALNPHLMEILRVMVIEERKAMAPHLEQVINDVFELPVPVKLKWDTRCLRDSRLLFDMIKNGLNAGPISQTTYQKTAECDPDEERELKGDEAKLPKEKTHPLYDAAHGPPDKGGKKPGSKDAS